MPADASMNASLTCSSFPGHLCILSVRASQARLVRRDLSDTLHIAVLNV